MRREQQPQSRGRGGAHGEAGGRQEAVCFLC